MKNILVPTDFSDLAKNALKFAIKIAHPLKCKITLFHTMNPILIANDMGGFIYPDTEEEENLINKKIETLLEFIKNQGVIADKVIHKGVLGDSLLPLIEKEKIDLIITGTSGSEGLEAMFFGTNSVSIFEKVKCPVLIVPAHASYHSIKKIMYATDFQYGDIHELVKICALAKPFNAQVIVTHINSDDEKFVKEEEIMDWFIEIGNANIDYKNIVYKLIYNPNVLDALENAITILDIDIICMSTVEKLFFKRLISKNHTKQMAYHSRIPLMALHLSEDNKLD